MAKEINQFFRKIAQVTRKVPELARQLPKIAKVEGLQFIADNFQKQGFETKKGQYKRWQRKQKGVKPTLIGEKRGGSLRRSWETDTKTTSTRTEFTSQKPYAGVHNEGLMAGRPPGFIMPERKMIGDSEALNERIIDKATRQANKILN